MNFSACQRKLFVPKPTSSDEIINLTSSLNYSKSVIPIHKKGSKLKCYRPISLLTNLDKILERMVYNRIYGVLERCRLIYLLQFGF